MSKCKLKFPLAKTLTVASLSFAINFGLILTFSFQPFMISNFYPEYTSEQVGTKTGYVNGSFYIGSVLGGTFWGILIDIWGRRPSILLTTILSLIVMIMFGLSPTFLWALVTRFLWGTTIGAAAAYKAYLGEILTDEQQPRGFLIFGVVTGLSTVTGPIVGGFLAQPAEKYSLFRNEFFCQFPFFLPVLVPVALNIISFIASILFISETTEKRIPSCCPIPSEDAKYELLPNDNDNEFEKKTDVQSDCSRSSGAKLSSLIRRFFKFQQRECILCFVCQTSKENSYSCSSLWKKTKHLVQILLCDRKVVLSLSFYFAFGVVDLSVYQIYILLMVSDKEHGGFSMSDSEVGFSFLLAGITEALVLLVLYPYLVKCFGYRGLLALGFFAFAISTAVISWVSTIFSSVEYSTSTITAVNESIHVYCDSSANGIIKEFGVSNLSRLPVQIWLFILGLLAFLTVFRTICRVTTIVMINNSTFTETAGIVNGVASSLRGLAGGVTQIVFGALFTWSQNNTTWPLNYHFTFIISAVFLICILPIINLLPASIEQKRKKTETTDSY